MLDLREFLEELQQEGELNEIEKEVDWNLELGAISSMANRTGAQAVHFKKIKGFSDEYSVAANIFSGPGSHYPYKRSTWGRVAIGLELEKGIDYEGLIDTVIDRFYNPIFPMEVTTASCKENVITGDDVDLRIFPFPLLHKGDGDSYITSGVLVTRDLDSDWHNWGVYRCMILGKDEMVADFLSEPSVSNDTRLIYERYVKAGKPMPFALVLGGPPAIMMAAAMSVPENYSEVDFAGGLNLDPISLIKGETVDMFVPGEVEVVIEGEISHEDMAEEGPYGSVRGFTNSCMRPRMKVKAITHRNSPIIPMIVDGTKVCDTQVLISLCESARVTRICREDGQPIRWFQIPADWNLSIGVASAFNPAHGVVNRLAHHILGRIDLFDKLVIVDTDVFPTELHTVVQDWINKAHSRKDYHVINTGWPKAVAPYYRDEVPAEGAPRLYIDACWPAFWGPEERPTALVFETTFPRDLQEKVVTRWKEEFDMPVEPVMLPEGQR
ncbi:MAG: UbiD family decarboxylase [Thermodesulfobacteriota bacterium]|nr:UbiD family decarboxylase [Thermodesulfobacteriota bacterium]